MLHEQSVRRVPYWAIGLLLIVLMVLASYVLARFQIPVDGLGSSMKSGECVVKVVTKNSPAEKAGILPGDIILGIENKPVSLNGHKRILEGYRAGDRITYVISVDNEPHEIELTLVSLWSQNNWFYLAFYSLIFIVCTTSLYILYRKPYDQSARIFFIFLQLFAIAQNQSFLYLDTAYALFATIIFIFGFNLFGVVLLHFYLVFPTPVPFYNKIKRLLRGIYLVGILFGIALAALHIWRNYAVARDTVSIFNEYSRYLLLWMALTLSMALGIAIYQYRNAQDSHTKKQLQLVLIGSLFGLLPAISYSIFPDLIWQVQQEQNMQSTIEFVNGIGTYIMTTFLAIAIFRYRIWNLEIIFRKALQYGAATFIIFLLYFGLVAIIDSLLAEANELVHLIMLAFSILIFLFLRDLIQKYIDKLFYRESYDSTKVVTDFEKQFAGINKFSSLASGIEEYLNGIFHFNSFLFAIRGKELSYKIVQQMGGKNTAPGEEFEITERISMLLEGSGVISIEEISMQPSFIAQLDCEILVPLMNGEKPFGFFLLGRKISDKSYNLQDIRLLTLLSHRIVSMFYTANLYQRDLKRQLMLERERTRIARDIHDDVGASLTRISIMSDLIIEKATDPESIDKWLRQISETSRQVTSEMTQIIWALTPRNDTFEGLSTYVRRFANEYLEPSNIQCEFTCPDALNNMELRAESRRNIFLSIREALHNVVKHSSANKVFISFNKEQDWVTVDVKDDGEGFNTSESKKAGNGLINIKKRMKSIGGKSTIFTNPGKGAEIRLFIPI